MSDLAATFWALFEGRTDIFGNAENPAVPFYDGDPVERMASHLHGFQPIGVYPMRDDQLVKWGCVDFDEGYVECLPHALNLKAVLAEFGVIAWIEKTRSKGYHVWVFANRFVPGKPMRQALLAACQIVSAPTKEINPKQEALEEGKVGNFVRLPYPRGYMDNKQTILNPEHDYHEHMWPNEFVEQALGSPCDLVSLMSLADLYVEPRPKFIPRPYEEGHLDRFPPLVVHIIKQPPPPPAQGGRSSQMVRLAHVCHDEGMTYEDTKLALYAYDEVWGKFVSRQDRDLQIRRMVDRAF